MNSGNNSQALSPEQEVEWRSRIRKTLFVPDELPDLDARTHGRFEPEPGVVAERVSYGTQFGMRVPAILYLPEPLPAGKIPAFIVVLEDTTVNIPVHGEPFLRDLRRRTAKLRGSDAGVFELGFVPNAAHRPYFVTRPVALWLDRQVDFPRWMQADIDAMMETHISAWARDRAVEMDRLYASEEREGGTPALGRDVPGLSREDLSVFSEGEWEGLKDRLTHESWRREARALIAK